MRKQWMVLACIAGAAYAMNLASCKHGCKSGHASHHGGDDSHNMGRNCQDCHHADGEGEVCWQVCGTAYDSVSGDTKADVTVRLWTEPGDSGQLVLTLEGDAFGNFYTSDDPGVRAGLYPTVTTADGHVSRMTDRISTGACNGCHGVSTERIKVH